MHLDKKYNTTKPISSKIDITKYPLKKLEELYWITNMITDFQNWIARFWKKDKSQWWIREDWFIIWEGFRKCWMFKNWIAIFTQDNWTQWWIRDDWFIIGEWLRTCNEFTDWIATFRQLDLLEWFIDKNWNILIKGDFATQPFTDWVGKAVLVWRGCNILATMNLQFNSWFCTFQSLQGNWWVNDRWIVLDNLFRRVAPFDEDAKWYAWYEEDWRTGYIDTKWSITKFKQIFPLNEEFEWVAKFKTIFWEEWYIDIKWREWDNVEVRNGDLYLQKDDKWFCKNLIK
jgi:hypothetical protein